MRFSKRNVEEFPSREAIQYWPKTIIEFLEQKIKWIISNEVVDDNVPDPVETNNEIDELPQQILCKFKCI